MRKFIILAFVPILLTACATSQNIEPPQKTGETSPQTRSVTVLPKFFENTTYLMEKSFTPSSGIVCSRSLYALFAKNSFSMKNPEVLEHPIFKHDIAALLGNENSFLKLKDDFNAYLKNNPGYDGIFSLCKQLDKNFVILPTDAPASHIAVWTENNGFQFFQDSSGEIKKFPSHNQIELVAISQIEDKVFYRQLYRDPPVYFRWAFDILDTKTMMTEEVEDCELTTADKNERDYRLSCQSEYDSPPPPISQP